MASSGAVRVRFEAETSGLRQGVETAAETLEKFEKGTSRAERGAKAFAGAITAVTGASGGAVGAISTLIGGFAMGGPMGLAIGGVQALVSAITDIRRESAQAEKEAKEHAKQIADAMRDAADAVGRARFTAAGGNASDYEATLKASRDQAKADQEAAKAKKELADATAAVVRQRQVLRNLLTSGQAEAALPAELKELDRLLAVETEKRAALQAAAEWKANLAETASRAVDATTKTEAEKVAKAEEDKRKEYQRTAAEKLRLARAADKEVTDRLKAETDQEIQEANERGEVTKYLADRELKESQKQRARDEAARKAQLAAYEQWGERMGTIFAGVMTGAMTPAEAFKAIMGEVVKSVIQSAIATVQAQAAAAAAGAAASQAPIPVAGPGMAVAALSMMQALVLGLLSSIPARRYGGDVLAGLPYLIGEEGPEIVKFPRSGTVIPNSRIGREAGGGGITVNVAGAIVSDRDLERIFVARESGISRAMRKIQRRRRF